MERQAILQKLSRVGSGSADPVNPFAGTRNAATVALPARTNGFGQWTLCMTKSPQHKYSTTRRERQLQPGAGNLV